MKYDKTILIVDDVESIRDGMTMIFSRLFSRCLSAENGVEALEICARDSIDVLVTDVVMPKMDGITLVERVLQEYPKIYPVVIISGEASAEQMQRVAATGVQTLKKPVDVEALLAIIDASLGTPEQ